ncbi:MAG: histidinol-phosphate transaminase [Polyangiales bacterium]
MTVESLKTLFRRELSELEAYRVPPSPPRVKLDANESPWPLPGEAWETILSAVRRTALHRYPDGRATTLRDALTANYGGTADGFVIGSGSDELIALLATAMCRPPAGKDRPVVLYPEPTFVMYGITSLGHGWTTAGIPLDPDWDLDVDAMGEAIEREQPNLVYYATPNNPTGNTFTRERIEALVARHPNTLHVIDEAYAPFAGGSLSSLCDEYPQCAMLGTLSKVGFAAIRVGWTRLHPELARELEKVRQPFNLNALSQEIATLALTDLAPLVRSQARAVAAERELLATALREIPGISTYPSQANFLLLRIEGNPRAVCEGLLERGIAVRRFDGHPRLAQCIRITVGTPEENGRLVEALGEVPCR